MDKNTSETGRVWSRKKSDFFAKVLTILFIVGLFLFMYLHYGISPNYILKKIISFIIIRYKHFSIKDAFMEDSRLINSDKLFKPYFFVLNLIGNIFF